ncbi:hypothetical protein MKW94_024879 [Papaver nudicaule]|uniref:Ribosomal protein L5 n=1 Tax=Papaver nudicaule TaxID=74823 RepID=A0AA41RTV9_PAPNU|nr:hypothetical protein [Papaver nudicaule]
MFPLSFHYEDVSRQDPLLKLNHANVMEVPGSCEIIVVPTPSDFRIQNKKLAMEIPRGQRFIQREPQHQVSKSNPFEKDGGSVSDLARHSSLRGQGMSHFLILRSKSKRTPFNSPWKRSFANSPRNHFEIFEHIRGFNVTIVTSANTQDETLSSWSGFFQQDGAQED